MGSEHAQRSEVGQLSNQPILSPSRERTGRPVIKDDASTVQDERKTSSSQEIDVNSFHEEPISSERTGRPVIETSVIQAMGRRPMKDVLGNHLKDRLFHLVHWLSITLKLRRTSQESINLERKSYLDCSSDMHCTRGNLER